MFSACSRQMLNLALPLQDVVCISEQPKLLLKVLDVCFPLQMLLYVTHPLDFRFIDFFGCERDLLTLRLLSLILRDVQISGEVVTLNSFVTLLIVCKQLCQSAC